MYISDFSRSHQGLYLMSWKAVPGNKTHNIIEVATDSEFIHSSYSFVSSFKPYYEVDRVKHGPVFRELRPDDKGEKREIDVQFVPLSEAQFVKIKGMTEQLLRKKELAYDLPGIATASLHKATGKKEKLKSLEKIGAFTCSGVISYLLRRANVGDTVTRFKGRESSSIYPKDLLSLPFAKQMKKREIRIKESK